MDKKVEKHHLLAFMLAIILLITGAVFASRFSALNFGGSAVLADEDGDEDKDEDESNDDSDKEAAEKDEEKTKKDAEKQKELKKKESEKTKKEQKKISGVEDDDDSNEDEDEADDADGEDEDEDEVDDADSEDENADEKDEDEVENVTRQTITNTNGTTTETITKTEGAEIKTIAITRDQNGNIIERKVAEKEGGKQEVKTIGLDIYGKKLSEVEMKTVDGKVVKIEAKEGSQKVKYETDEDDLVIDYDDDEDEEFDEEGDEIRIKTEGNAFGLKKKEVEIKVNFPMEVDGETGKIYIVTPNGKVELKAMPDVIKQKAQDAGMDSISKLELKAEDNKLKYEVEGTKDKKFLGVFKIKIKSTQQYNPESGNLLSETQSLWENILESLSFGE